jgi:hypothetical protein
LFFSAGETRSFFTVNYVDGGKLRAATLFAEKIVKK